MTTVNYTASDANGNAALATSFTVTVTDDEAPEIKVSDISKCFEEDDNGCSIDLGATANDNCELQSLTSDAPSCFPVGTTTVTWTAIDIHNNVATATQTVTRNKEINVAICAGTTRTIYTGQVSGMGPFGPQGIKFELIGCWGILWLYIQLVPTRWLKRRL